MNSIQSSLGNPISENNLKLKSILAQAQTTSNIVEIIPDLINELKKIWRCKAITLFALDRENRQLFSRNIIENLESQVRVDISTGSLAGYVAGVGKPINLADAYSEKDLSQIHPQLSKGSTLDGPLGIRTQAIMVLPVPHNKKLIGVMEVINKRRDGEAFADADFKLAREISPALGNILARLEEEYGLEPLPVFKALSPEENLHRISQAIHSAKNIDEILIELKESILKLFEAQAITIYAVDSQKNEIFSKVKSGDHINEIRVPISPVSIAGWVASHQRSVNITDVYDEQELQSYHADLKFDSSWDKKSGSITKSVLGFPMIHAEKLMGVLQLVNKWDGTNFTEQDEKSATIIAETLALAFHNQAKYIPSRPTKFSFLIQNGIITEEELTQATAKARKNQIDVETVLLMDFKLQRNDLGKSFEDFYGLPYFGYSDTVILPAEMLTGLNRNFLTKNYWIPIQKEGDKVTILINDPLNPDRNQNIRQIFLKKEIEYKIGLKIDIVDFLNSSLGMDLSSSEGEPQTEELSSLLSALKNEQGDVDMAQDEDDGSNAISETDSTIVRLVNKILIDAYDQGVSDIHIEPGIGKDSVMVRYRKDGACRIYEEIPSIYKQALISRIKIMSKLDIAERRLPQDGKIKMKYGKKEIEYRVATCPTVGGNEDAVLRILAASKPIPLENMNFNQRNLELIQATASKPYGLILVVGPTGSGKTTTLHSTLGYINKPERKIWTAEDPVEITQKGLRQVQMLNKIGLDFARAMRSFLRGDPDVIMVGEMRDAETCAIGLEASLTGHLVFSTLHTNSAPETITRLLDMGMNPLNFADALLLIVAQRLVRTLCKKCKEDYHPDQEEYTALVREYGNGFEKLNIEYSDDLMLKKPVGCQNCSDTGYAGRTGLHECLEGTEEIKRMVMKHSLVEDLRKQAIEDGMTTLKQDGIYKVFKGDCDLKQVMAVCIV
ncbi:MAG: pilus assembly protein [Nitrospinae bacterium CG22_combo_CG10-13_8_21_14_all_47_10]|nr:MAG: pilus assembly protein [Nitrospinae bacterium CG22_combo_CG10-13_8_21_14_all_47_10]